MHRERAGRDAGRVKARQRALNEFPSVHMHTPLFMFTVGRSKKILSRCTDFTGGKTSGDFQIATFQKLEEPFRVFLFLAGRLLKEGGDLFVAFLPCHAGKKSGGGHEGHPVADAR